MLSRRYSYGLYVLRHIELFSGAALHPRWLREKRDHSFGSYGFRNPNGGCRGVMIGVRDGDQDLANSQLFCGTVSSSVKLHVGLSAWESLDFDVRPPDFGRKSRAEHLNDGLFRRPASG